MFTGMPVRYPSRIFVGAHAEAGPLSEGAHQLRHGTTSEQESPWISIKQALLNKDPLRRPQRKNTLWGQPNGDRGAL